MTERKRWRQRVFLGALPVVGLLLVGGLLWRQLRSPSSQGQTDSVKVVHLPSPSTSLSVVASPSPSRSPAKPPLIPVNPAALSESQKNINRQSKAALIASTATVDSLVEMRVAIAEGVPSLNLSTPNGAVLLDQKGQMLHKVPTGFSSTVQPDGKSLRLGDWMLPAIVMIDPAVGGQFQLGDRTYRGRLLLVADSGNLWAVNYINLRQYLHSVVGSEVSSSWPSAALKAQAVAARSYALTYYFRPVTPLYHLGATEYYQVYGGIEREAASTREAVDKTAGEFVSYRGGIVESLYAASDDIVADAFQGHGMSQLGALALAEKGYTYQQILSNYYPKTGVARVQEDVE